MSNKNPGGITDNSPGSRRNSADHPGMDVLLNPHPERCARNAGSTKDIPALCDPLPGSNLLIADIPRVFVAHSPRPGAKFCNPSGMEKV
jgi:hypothetical protein